ncbi:glycine cleavage system aminomethyltransferase GcvT [candidate division KSB1 bacterium]|nr:glycine cleavage system aminomethyltransferase GcvT [candidate division KSB1 bacterium]
MNSFKRCVDVETKKTALYERHQNLGAKLVEFAGYWMPIQYRGILEEHRRVRTSVGLFDVSHMGEFRIQGEKALDFLQFMTINNVANLSVNQVQYSAMCYEAGGIVDDLLVYRLPKYYLTVVNASNLVKDFNWLQSHLMPGVELTNLSDDYALLALQGRDSQAILQKMTAVPLANLSYYWIAEGEVAGVKAFISRTGYTGELGYEIGCAPENAVKVWDALMTTGKPYHIEPIGLGARDTLRLEMKYCLYGNDIDATTNPLEAGLGWITKLQKGNFLGQEALLKIKAQGLPRKLVGLVTEGKAIPRHGYQVLKGDLAIGVVTSGSISPMLDRGIAMAYVATEHSALGTSVEIDMRKKRVPAKVVETPFYKVPAA